MNCIVIEDQPPAQRILRKYIEDAGSLQLKEVFSDAVKAIEYMKHGSVELIFLDIHLPKLSGIDFLKSMTDPPFVILTTAFPDYALKSYEFNVVDYLLKPFSFQRFIKAISKVPVIPQVNQISVNELFIKSGYEYIKINIDEILYIKSDADYTEIHLRGKKLLSSEPLSYWQQKLNIVRVHKSYIINGLMIEKISTTNIHLSDLSVIPIGRAYKSSFLERFLK